MTEHHIEVVRVGTVEKHPNADTLSLTRIHGGYPVIFQSGTFKEGDLAVYIPVDSIVPQTEEWAWLSPPGNVLPRDKDRRIRAKRLRGVFSMGLLTSVPEDDCHVSYNPQEGDDVATALGITRYEEPEPGEAGQPGYRGVSYSDGLEVGPPSLPCLPGVYDIEPFRKYGAHWFEPGEHLVVTEKIHGQNASFVHDGSQLHIKSRKRWLVGDLDAHGWGKVAAKYNLTEVLAKFPGILLFGETYGNNTDMRYGVWRDQYGDEFIAFDAFDTSKGEFLSYREFKSLCSQIAVPTVPVLAELIWGDDSLEQLIPLAEGPTTLGGDVHVREGFVIKPKLERRTRMGDRVILKMHGEGFLTRKGA